MKEALNIQTELGINDPNKLLSELGFAVATAQTKFPDYWRKWKEWGRADADFLKNTWFTASSEQLSWMWGGCNLYAGGCPGGVAQNGTPIKVNGQLRWPFGAFEGTGVFMGARFSTVMKPDHDRWNGDPKFRNVLVSPSYATNGLFAYHEGAYLDAIRFDGDKRSAYWDQTFESSGAVLWDAGEGSQVGHIKADNFNDFGLRLERGTPADVLNLSAFCNNRAGLGLVGTALATIKIGVISGDDNGRLIEFLPGGGREAGGNVHVLSAKLESATIGEGQLHKFHRYTGHPYAIVRGQTNFLTDMLTYSSSWVQSGQLFWVDDRISTGIPQASRIECRGKGFGFAALLVDSRRGTYYPAPPDYSAWHMVYLTSTGELFLNGTKQTPLPFAVGAGPLGFITAADWQAGKRFDFAAGTPQQQITSTTPPPPTPVPVPTPTPTPLPTPPPTTFTDTMTEVEITSSIYSKAAPSTWTNITDITLTNLKVPVLPVAPNGVGYIMGSVNSGIAVLPNGSIVDSRNGQVLASAGTVKANTAITVPLARLNTPWTFTFIGAIPGTGIGMKCTVGSITVSR